MPRHALLRIWADIVERAPVLSFIESSLNYPKLLIVIIFGFAFFPFVSWRLVKSIFTGTIDLHPMYRETKFKFSDGQVRFFYYFSILLLFSALSVLGIFVSIRIILENAQ
jgi:hypothetical protein